MKYIIDPYKQLARSERSELTARQRIGGRLMPSPQEYVIARDLRNKAVLADNLSPARSTGLGLATGIGAVGLARLFARNRLRPRALLAGGAAGSLGGLGLEITKRLSAKKETQDPNLLARRALDYFLKGLK